MKNLSKTKKVILFVVLNAIVWGAAVFFYMEAERAKREAAVMQDIQHRMLGIGKYATKIKAKIFVNYYNECPGEGTDPAYSPTGMDVANYCAGVTTDATTVTRMCLELGLAKIAQRDHGYGDRPPATDAEVKELACGIAGTYPEKTDDWEDTTLSDHLNNILQNYANEILK